MLKIQHRGVGWGRKSSDCILLMESMTSCEGSEHFEDAPVHQGALEVLSKNCCGLERVAHTVQDRAPCSVLWDVCLSSLPSRSPLKKHDSLTCIQPATKTLKGLLGGMGGGERTL